MLTIAVYTNPVTSVFKPCPNPVLVISYQFVCFIGKDWCGEHMWSCSMLPIVLGKIRCFFIDPPWQKCAGKTAVRRERQRHWKE